MVCKNFLLQSSPKFKGMVQQKKKNTQHICTLIPLPPQTSPSAGFFGSVLECNVVLKAGFILAVNRTHVDASGHVAHRSWRFWLRWTPFFKSPETQASM